MSELAEVRDIPQIGILQQRVDVWVAILQQNRDTLNNFGPESDGSVKHV